ncbi:MFS transporter [Planotetraspora kaengkrachanensis]|uniref:MFS transporter n=1 Tax=Planotetraspora kaengkrachanensis TaxID=575193 RepID=A0A8J3VCB1_9ACTN|nr:MFS transporter [Planotetraspora kaengkrachanensis]GIG84658.1 MFS transporter [Planotetraspora kaengkrachanensis]
MYLADRGPTAATAPSDADHGRTDRAAQPGRALRAIPATVLALGTVSLITDISSEMVTAVLPLYVVAGLGLSPLGFGVLDGVYNGVSGLVRLFGGHLADRGRRHKAVAVIGYGLSAVCKPLLLIAHTLPLISGVLALDRTGKGIRTAPRDAMISLASTPENRGRAFGVHRAMDTGGALLGPIVAFLVLGAAADGYDAVFTVSFCIAALGVLVLVLFVPGGRAPATAPLESVPAAEGVPDGGGAAPGSPPVTLRSAMALLRIPDVRRLTVTATLLGLTTVSDAFVYLMLQHRLGISERLFPLLPLGTAFFFLVLAMPLGVLADRVGRRRVFLGGHVALLLAYGLLLMPLDGDVLPFVVLALHGTFYAATDGVLPAAAAGAVPAELRASGLALIGTGQALARFCCSIAFGALWTVIGDRAVLGIAMAGLALCAAWAAYALRGPETA